MPDPCCNQFENFGISKTHWKVFWSGSSIPLTRKSNSGKHRSLCISDQTMCWLESVLASGACVARVWRTRRTCFQRIPGDHRAIGESHDPRNAGGHPPLMSRFRQDRGCSLAPRGESVTQRLKLLCWSGRRAQLQKTIHDYSQIRVASAEFDHV